MDKIVYAAHHVNRGVVFRVRAFRRRPNERPENGHEQARADVLAHAIGNDHDEVSIPK